MPRFIIDSSVNLTLNPFPEHIRDNRREVAQRRRAVRIPPSRIRVNPRNPWSNIPLRGHVVGNVLLPEGERSSHRLRPWLLSASALARKRQGRRV